VLQVPKSQPPSLNHSTYYEAVHYALSSSFLLFTLPFKGTSATPFSNTLSSLTIYTTINL